MAETRDRPARPFLSVLKRGDGRPSEFRKWISTSWPSVLMLLFIFILALFVRSYFGYSEAHDNGNLVSGGSDSYYWERIIDYSAHTGKQLYLDPLLNFPSGIRNPRPPMFSMSVVVPGVILQHGFPSLEEALSWTLLWTPAFWGALTVIPTYLLGKETFGRRVGLVAGFFLAVMPSHVQRSVLSDADHDSFILFFIVLTFYLLLKAFKTQEQRKWVENWRSIASIRSGLREYFQKSRTPVLYALMAGVAYSCVIMTWVGFGYITVLILAYFIVQVLLNKLKGQDSMNVTIIVFLAMGLGFLLSYPVYNWQSLIPVRFDVPVYLFLASMAFGILFVVTRDYPWTVTFPAIGLLLVIGILGINAVDPALAQAILTGQGYFVQNKLYSTIAEAKAPVFSELALGFGMVTFFMSLAGLIWAVLKIPKNTTAQYILITVWLAAAIFMAISAARFMFNAAPAFAIASAWILVMVVDKLDFNSFRKSISGASGSYLHVLRKSLKIRHVLGALFLAFMIVLPNVWYSIDAGIPQEIKVQLDRQIYDSIPKVLRPSGYNTTSGSEWYLGAFGYSLPLPKFYFPAAWSWFSARDANVSPESAKPAFVAWWDYGFEAIQAGEHPTVADNFQNGYQITGNALMAQSETDLIAIFAYRLIEVAAARGGALESGVLSILDQYGVNSTRMLDILTGPGGPLIKQVLSDPAVYGPMASDLDDTNARIVSGRVELAKLGTDNLVSLYGALVDFTGWDIRYFFTDSRMFPSSGQNTGIFYAPAKLSDRRIARGSTPIDFFDVLAVTTAGQTVSIENVTADMQIQDYILSYKPMFYSSMFYRGMVGYAPSEIGFTNDGVPGLSGSTKSGNSMPGWNMTHFALVYRTAYYNPLTAGTPNFGNGWTAVNIDQALLNQQLINSGELPGYVDVSAISFYGAGASFLEYYKGAYVNGTITTDQGEPVANMHATMWDRYGIPHGSVLTDANGHYSLLAPPGNDTVVISAGNITQNPQLVSSNVIVNIHVNVTDDQAMREQQDLDNNGIFDYIFTENYVMKGTEVTATIFWDLNGDGNYTASEDQLVQGSKTFAAEKFTKRVTEIDSTSGTFDVQLAPGTYDFNVPINGLNITMGLNVTVTAGQKVELKGPIKPGTVQGTAETSDGTPASNVTFGMVDVDVGFSYLTTTTASGNFTFEKLLQGNYSVFTTVNESIAFREFITVTAGQTTTQNVTFFPSSNISFTVLSGGSPVPFAAYMMTDDFDPSSVLGGITDPFGRIELRLPTEHWTLYASSFNGTATLAGAVSFDTSSGQPASGVVQVYPSTTVEGNLRTSSGSAVSAQFITFQASSGARIAIKTSDQGRFNIVLPFGTYGVTSTYTEIPSILSTTMDVSGPINTQIRMSDGAGVSGKLSMVTDAVTGLSSTDVGRFGDMRINDNQGNTITTKSKIDGSFSTVFPLNEQVLFSLANPGYTQGAQLISFSDDQNRYQFVALPDNVTVSGTFTNNGVGIRGVSVSFLPDSFLGMPVTVVTGVGGFYSASVPPSKYNVSVNQKTGSMDGERYIFSAEKQFLPSGVPEVLDISAPKKVQMFGDVLGGSTDIQIALQGPEVKNINPGTLNYSVFLLPGNYSVYVTSVVNGVTFANASLVTVTVSAREHDFALARARTLQGVITIGTSSVAKPVTIVATSSLGAAIRATSSSQGFYVLQLPTGSYSINFSLEDKLVQGGRSLFVEYSADLTVTIGTSDLIRSPSLALRFDNTTLSGKIVGPTGSAQQARIDLIPSSNLGEASTIITDATGGFSKSVQPGEYTVYVTRTTDKTAALSHLSITRNVPAKLDIALQRSSYVNGKALLGGTGVQVTFSLSSSAMNAKMTIVTDSRGDFMRLLPPGNYTLTSSSFRIENTLNVTYSLSTNVVVGNDDVFQELNFGRDTKRTALGSWNTSLTQTARPGQGVDYLFTVTNTGNIEDDYLVTFTGSGFNVTLSPSELQLDFGVNNQAVVVAHIVPQNTIAAGNTSVPILVRSKLLATTRAQLSLYVNVGPFHAVKVTGLNNSAPVSSRSTITQFELNNTGNIEDSFTVGVSNQEVLASLGWRALVIDPETNATVSSVSLPAFGSKTLEVRFTEIRTDADPTANAVVQATSKNSTGISAYGPVAIKLPDLVLGPSFTSLQATRADVSYHFNFMPLYMDLGLLAALGALMIMFFILRKRKGFGGKGGAKK